MPSQIFKILETDYKKQKKLYTVRFKKNPKSTPHYYAYAIDDGTLSHDVSELEATIKAHLTGFFTRSFVHSMQGAAHAGPIGVPAFLVFLGFMVVMIALGIDEDLVGPFLAIYVAWPVFSLLDLGYGKRHIPTYRLAMEELKALGAERLSLRNLPKPSNSKKIFKWVGIVIGVPVGILVIAFVWMVMISPNVVGARLNDQIIRVEAVYEENLEIAESRKATDEELKVLRKIGLSVKHLKEGLSNRDRNRMDWGTPEILGDNAIFYMQEHLDRILSPKDRAAAEAKAEVEAKRIAEEKAKEDARRTAYNASQALSRATSNFEKHLRAFNIEVVTYNKVVEDFKVFNVKAPAAPKAPAINLDGLKTAKEVESLTSQIEALWKKLRAERKDLALHLHRANKAEEKKQLKLTKISNQYDNTYGAYLRDYKRLHSAMSNASNIKKLRPYIAKMSSKLIAKEDFKNVGTYNERVDINNMTYRAYKEVEKNTNRWKETIRKYNAGRL